MLERLISKAGLSREDVAERLNGPVEMVNDWVEWKAVPGVEHCHALADVLGVQLYDVYLALITH